MTKAIEGGCLCGAVRYRIDEESVPPCYACHCADCQTQSGSAVALQMPVWVSKFSVEGETIEGTRQLPGGAIGTVHTCATCLTRLHTINSSRPGIVIVRAGTLDDSASLEPKAHMWVRSKQPWMTIPEGVRTYETQPEIQGDWIEILKLDRRAP